MKQNKISHTHSGGGRCCKCFGGRGRYNTSCYDDPSNCCKNKKKKTMKSKSKKHQSKNKKNKTVKRKSFFGKLSNTLKGVKKRIFKK